MGKISDSEYKAYMNNIYFLEGEKIELSYLIQKVVIGRGDGSNIDHLIEAFMEGYDDPNRTMTLENGLLVFTNINIIFIQEKDYSRSVVLLDQLAGLGCFLYKGCSSIAVATVDGYEYGFILLKTEDSSLVQNPNINELTRQIQIFGMEQKRLAQGPAVKICKYCSAQNKADQTRCVNCGALLA